MKRWGAFFGLGVVVLVVACGEPTGPGTGGIALNLSVRAAGQAQAGTLDAIRVAVTGPMNKTVDSACTATTCSVVVDGLTPGTYAVVVEGLVGGAVDHYGTASSVTVSGGKNTAATIPFASFQPVLTLSQDTTEVLAIPVSFNAVAGATSYVVEWSQAQDFTGAQSATVTGTVDTIAVADSGQYYVRVRAVNADVGSNGRASVPGAVYVTHGVATVTLTPGTPTVAAGATLQLTATAVDINGDTVPGVTFFWSSGDQSVATVDQSGLVTGKGVGQATITAVGKGQPGSMAVTVTFGAPAQLAFRSAPAAAEPFFVMDTVRVAVEDAYGNQTNAAVNVTLAIGSNPSSGALTGTKTVQSVNGVATFPDLAIDSTGTGYTLQATASNVTSTSTGLDVGFHLVKLDGGYNFGCGLSDRGNVFCWGDNSTGQLANNTNVSSLTPLAVLGGHTFSSLAVGYQNGCGIEASDSAAYCWGWNAYGQVGDGTSGTNRLVPTAVSGNFKFLSLSVGTLSVCGILADSTAVCWGYNANGQIGDGTSGTNRLVPTGVSGGNKFSAISVGYTHACGIIASSGLALCWGSPASGELGNGTNTGTFYTPQAVSSGFAYSAISAGYLHTCAVRTDGIALCWGYNTNGQVGDNSTTERDAPVSVYGGFLASSIASSYFTTCAVEARSGAAFCWGNSDVGALGNGVLNVAAANPAPVAVVGGHTFSAVSANEYQVLFNCGLASDGAYCWGQNNAGQLGDGSTTSIAIPVRVKGSR